jgi:serine/threonine protein kinase
MTETPPGSAGLPCPYCGWNGANKQESAHHLPFGILLKDGRYYIGRALGQGGFGITYLGWDNAQSTRVAIKEYFPLSLVTRSPGDQSVSFAGEEARADFDYGLVRFMDEARVLASLSSASGIVAILDVFQENSLAYMVMEYLDGKDLKRVLSESGGRIPHESALNIALHIIDALRDVHAQGLMHRDVSPDNIFIGKDGSVKLIDFGAARFAFGTQNKSLSVVLKPSYAPVEQYQTRGNQGPWTDIYALGATLYRCVTGRLPPESLSRLESDKLMPPSELGIVIPLSMEAAIHKALAVKPKDRFQSMQEFRDAILEVTRQPQVTAEALEKTRRVVMHGPALRDQTVVLSTNACGVDLTLQSGKASNTGESWEETAVLGQTALSRAEEAKQTGAPQTGYTGSTETKEAKRTSGARRWIALAMSVIIVLAGAFWAYTYIYTTDVPVELEPREPDQPVPVPDPIPDPIPDPDPPALNGDELYQSGRILLDNGDLPNAKSFLEQAADLGHAKAMSALGFLSQRQGDQQKSYEWYAKAAAAGDEEAMMPLALFYYFGQAVPKDYKTAVSLLRPLADEGNANARIMLSSIFEEGGYGIDRNPEEAARYRK